jgi:energy-coupling factor transport system permease protein
VKGAPKAGVPGAGSLKAPAKLLLLGAYTFAVFFITDLRILAALAAGNILLILITGAGFLRALGELTLMLPFIAFAALINLLLGDLSEMILVTLRLILVCSITFIFRRRTGSMELAGAAAFLFYPVKLFGADPEDLGLMVCIAVAFIPVLRRELEDIIRALASKGMKASPKNAGHIFKPFLGCVLKRSNEIALALKAKGCE